MIRGGVSASTIDLDDLSARVGRLAVDCGDRAGSLFGVVALVPGDRQYQTQALAQLVADISDNLTAVSTALASTSQTYALREELLSSAAHELTSTLFWALGRTIAVLAPAVIPAVLGGAIALLAASAFTGRRPEDLIMTAVTRAAKAVSPSEGAAPSHARTERGRTAGASTAGASTSDAVTAAISSPLFVTGLEYAVSGIDDLAAGLMGLPRPLSAAIGERGLGLSDPTTVAGAIVLGAGVLGGALRGAGSDAPTFLQETPVSITRVSSEPGSAPEGIEDLVSRIPRADPQMPQMRIERYEGTAGGHPSFIVYLGGTIDAGLLATDEPWDMTSNLTALAAMDSGSYRAALDAMRAAGIGTDDPVLVVGHSQGGILAARIAESEAFRVSDVLTVGAPIHQVAIPGDVTVTAIEHTEDLVPTLGGVSLGVIAGATTTVRRSALSGRSSNSDDPLPGHNLSRYVETGRVVDQSTDPRLVALRVRLSASTQGAAEVTYWRAERLTAR